jgi:hypothetical protein
VIVYYLDIVRVALLQIKAPVPAVLAQADAPYIIDANTPLAGSITAEFFQSIGGLYSAVYHMSTAKKPGIS